MNRVIPIKLTTNIQEIVRTIICKDVDRLVIEDEKGNYQHYVTQNDLLKFLFINMDDLIQNSDFPGI